MPCALGKQGPPSKRSARWRRYAQDTDGAVARSTLAATRRTRLPLLPLPWQRRASRHRKRPRRAPSAHSLRSVGDYFTNMPPTQTHRRRPVQRNHGAPPPSRVNGRSAETGGCQRPNFSLLLRNVLAWEDYGGTSSRLGRKTGARGRNSPRSCATSLLGRARAEQGPGLGERLKRASS